MLRSFHSTGNVLGNHAQCAAMHARAPSPAQRARSMGGPCPKGLFCRLYADCSTTQRARPVSDLRPALLASRAFKPHVLCLCYKFSTSISLASRPHAPGQ